MKNRAITDTELEVLWEQFADVPVVEDASMLKESSLEGLSIEEGGVLLNEDGPYIDEDFHIWKRGTLRDDIWLFFDTHHSKGVAWLQQHDWK